MQLFYLLKKSFQPIWKLRAYFSYTSKVNDYTLEKLTHSFYVAIKEKMAEQLQKEDLIKKKNKLNRYSTRGIIQKSQDLSEEKKSEFQS